jgi:hypothetical protein
MSELDADFGGLYDKDPIEPQPYTGVYCVSVYLIDRAYGGPEEGGWWFDYGEPVLERDLPTPQFTTDKNEAWQFRDAMQKTLDATANVGRRPISSVLSEGKYVAIIDEGFPKAYPETRPHYE